MDFIRNSYKGASLLLALNWDRFLVTGALGSALLLAAWLARVAELNGM